MKKIKTFVCALLGGVMLSGVIASCTPTAGNSGETSFDLPDAPAGSTVNVGDSKALLSNGYRIEFAKGAEGYGIKLVDTSELASETATATNDSQMFDNETPAMINVRGAATTLLGSFSETSYAKAYSSVSKKDYGYLCSATVETNFGSSILVEDAYYVKENGVFAVSRRTEVKKSASGDVGYQSIYSLNDIGDSKKYDEFDYFIPSILYKDTQDMASGSIASNLNLDKVYVKETRTGLPLAMLRNKQSGYAVSIAHLESEITVNGTVGGGYNGAVNNDLQYGSIGYTIKSGVSVDFCYPSAEGPTTYDNSSGWSRIYHSVTDGTVQEYKLSITPTSEDTYAKAMTKSFKSAYTAEEPDIDMSIDIDQIYEDNIEVFDDTYKEFGTSNVTAAGVPWSIYLKDGAISEYTFQMGFVGQQAAVGYHLMNSGYLSSDTEMVEKGKTIIDFWTSSTIMGSNVPIVWWDPRDNESAGHSRGYPSFLRCFVDGTEGIFDAYRLALSQGEDNTQWKNAVLKVANFLVNNQNNDGSFYRAYNTDGSVCTDTSNVDYQGTSKRNTPIAVRFLSKMYEFTGEEKYKTAALAAAEYSYNNLYLGLEKYVGGTPDNPNTVDKEASIYAMYCFNSAYMLTGDAKYLEAAEHAAVSAMSWVFCYDFACPSDAASSSINPFTEGRISGFSIIATGHSGSDNFSAYMYYEFYKTYILTGDEFYLHSAKFLQNNTKLSTDYNGEMGWKYRALGPEASNVSDFSFSSVGVWLPWSGIANIAPIQNMRLTFGNADIFELSSDRETLLEQLEAYGVGGKEL